MKHPADRPAAQLGLWDVVSIILGIVVGAGIYETPPRVFSLVSGPAEAMAVWAACGLLAFVGALCYAELATTYPRSGGDYVYLGRAFGPWLGFLFGWAQLAVILTGSIGMMAYVFADYAVQLWELAPGWGTPCAAAAVVVLTLLNALGLVFGKSVQNLLTAAKVLGLGGILVAGFGWSASAAAQAYAPPEKTSLGLTLVFVLYTYGGWNDAAFVAAEMRNGARNIPRALLLGTGAVALLYVLVNAAYLLGLGFDTARNSKAIAAAVLAKPLGLWGQRAMCMLVMVSALGAVNGLIFSGVRVYSSLGADHPAFAWLGTWSRRRGAPLGALVTQAVICLGLIGLVGTAAGQTLAGWALTAVGLKPLAHDGRGGFDMLLTYTAPVFWLFFLLTGLSLFVLRERDADRPRPFRVPFYPYLPLVFCATCLYMLYSSADYAGAHTAVGGLLLLAGLPLYEVSRRMQAAAGDREGMRPPSAPAPPADGSPHESVWRPV
jgi:APA family basic amino acid/polyamine antiporter